MRNLSLIFYLALGVTVAYAQHLITPIIPVKYDKTKATLGKKLFFDTILSSDNSVSCATCHDIFNGGDDGLSVSYGVENKTGIRNAPTVLNSVFNISQFWDGRAKNLAEQIQGPIHNPVEMNNDFSTIVQKLSQDKHYKKDFKIYPSGITQTSIIDAIVEFEKSLVTPNSRFDKYLKGDFKALDAQEIQGYKLFQEYGCISCHNGINIGGNLYQKIGVMKEYQSSDLGRYEITHKDDDKYFFKVPSLRNIELTAPYFHDGSANNLQKAVAVMSEYQLGYPLEESEIDTIVKFLKTLTAPLLD
ncbi:MAG: cytochrome-c peroxidase [Campylobacterales bacterium]|nr:cytochrome-c peroxidase [Campylobacterales bacterium]